MFLKTHRSVRAWGVNRSRVAQRSALHLGELNTTQVDRWQRAIDTVQEDGRVRQMRLFTDREGQAPAAEDVAEVVLSSLVVRRPRCFGDAWVGCKLWAELGLDQFWQQALGEQRGEVPWAKVVELLAVNPMPLGFGVGFCQQFAGDGPRTDKLGCVFAEAAYSPGFGRTRFAAFGQSGFGDTIEKLFPGTDGAMAVVVAQTPAQQ
jgi:hypothetical protein